MDEKIKDQEVLLVKEQKTESLRAVAGADEKDGLKTVPPTAEHEQNTLTQVVEARAKATQMRVNFDQLDEQTIQKFNNMQDRKSVV